MGLARKIAFTGIGSIAAVIAIVYLANKTDLLNKITSGFSNLGSSLGLGIGGGVRNAAGGIIAGLTGIVPPTNQGGSLFPFPTKPIDPAGPNTAGGVAQDLGRGFADYLDQLFRGGSTTNNQANNATSSDKTINQDTRDYSDKIGAVSPYGSYLTAGANAIFTAQKTNAQLTISKGGATNVQALTGPSAYKTVSQPKRYTQNYGVSSSPQVSKYLRR